MKVAIVLVNYNGWADTRKCLAGLERVRAISPNAEVVLVDNASREDHLDALKAEYPWSHMIHNPINGGWAGGNNVGIRWGMEHHADQILLLNNDTIPADNLVELLTKAATESPEYGILGPVIAFMDEPDLVQTDGCTFNTPGHNGFFLRKQVPLEKVQRISEVEIVNGCCMMISAKVIHAIGLIDEEFFLIHEESDFNLRARQAGFKCGVINQKLVLHKGSSTFKATGSRIQRYYDTRNLLLLINKHANEHASGRGWFRSIPTYLKYVYYRYCTEHEQGNRDSANAVLEGFYDALAGRYGPMTTTSRWGLAMLRGVFELVRRIR